MLEIIEMKISDIKPFPQNAKKHPPEQIEQIRRSIAEFGMNDPIAIDERNVVIEGHGRLLALKAMRAECVPCIRLSHLTEEQKRAYILAHNKLTLNSGFDTGMLLGELDFLRDGGFDVSLTGFDAVEMEDLFREKTNGRVQEDNFDAEKAAAEIETPVSRRGDIWLLGRHRLMCGDSTASADVRALMTGARARCVFTDPPWNVDYGSDAKHPSWKPRQIMNDKMSAEQFGAFLLAAFRCMASVSEPGCMTYVVMSAQEWGNVMNALREAVYHWSSTIIWAKDSLVLSRKDYHTQYEPIWYGWFEGPGASASKRLCPLRDRKQSDLWQIPRPKVSEEHPTMKPVALVAKALMNSSRVGDAVLDLFGGSGTTLIAAEQVDRAAYMMELDPKYCDVIALRYYQSFPKSVIKKNGATIDPGKEFVK